MNFNLKFTNLSQQLKAGVEKDLAQQVNSAVAVRSNIAISVIGELLVNVLRNTPVITSLKYRTPEDLPAHFGLSDSVANTMADRMLDIVAKSVSLVTNLGKMRVGIQAVESSYREFLFIPGAAYISGPSAIFIPVMRWMLLDPTIDIGQAAYDIVFSGDSRVDPAEVETYSRSGRAVMKALKTLPFGSSYTLPSILWEGAGDNFIHYTLGQEGVVRQVAELAFKTIFGGK